MKFFVTMAFLMAFAAPVLSCSEDGSSGFLPENDLHIPANIKRSGGISEAQFNTVIDKVETIYSPIVSNMGAKLKINRKWDDGTVNANATRLGGWMVNMYGGLARHEAITADGFALVLCHEIGHHLGGSPKVGNIISRWASNEGQSDYFATLKCLRRVFNFDNNEAIVKKMKDVPRALTDACSSEYLWNKDFYLCVRSGMAGKSVAALFAALRSKPEAKFETPDSNVVSRTDDSHPAHQCRLDTYLQGALCDVSFNEDVSQRDEVKGTCHRSLGYTRGIRPLCWFKPKS